MRSLVFPILLFSSNISLHCWLKAFLSLFAILWNFTFSWVCLIVSSLPFTSLFFLAICKASSDNHFAFLHFFFFLMVLVTASYTMVQTSVHSSSCTLSDLILRICWSLPFCNHKGSDLGYIWMVSQSCLTLCDPMHCSTPVFPVLHYLLELAQAHVYQVGDAVQPPHPLSPPSPALNPTQHLDLFQWVSSLHQVAKVLELQLQYQSFQSIFRVDFL